MEAEEGSLFAEVPFTSFAVEFFFLSKDGGIVRTTVFNQVVDDAGKLMSGGRDSFGSSQPGFHAAEANDEHVRLTLRDGASPVPDPKDPVLAEGELDLVTEVKPRGSGRYVGYAEFGEMPEPKGQLAWERKVLSVR